MGTPPSIRSFGTVTSASTGTPGFAEPAGAAAADVIVCIWFQDDGRTSATNPTPPTGFVTANDAPQINDTAAGPPSHALQIWLGRRSTVGAGPYTFTIIPGIGSATPFCEGRALAVQDVPASFLALLEAADGATTGAGTSATAPAVSATSLGLDRLAVYAATNWSGGAWTPAGGYSEDWDANNRIITIDHLTMPAPAATSPQAVNASTDRMNAWVGIFPSATAADPGHSRRIPVHLLRLLLTRRQALLDAAASTTTPVTLADTAAAADTATVTAAIPLADTATAVDALTVTATANLADTAAATDALTVAAALPLTDTAAAADAIAVGVPKTLADTAAAADTVSISAQTPLADTGTAVDALTVTVQAALADTATAADILSVLAQAALADDASAVDALTTAAAVTLTDTAAAADAVTAGNTTGFDKLLADTGTAVDRLRVAVLRPDTGQTPRPDSGRTPRPYSGVTERP